MKSYWIMYKTTNRGGATQRGKIKVPIFTTGNKIVPVFKKYEYILVSFCIHIQCIYLITSTILYHEGKHQQCRRSVNRRKWCSNPALKTALKVYFNVNIIKRDIINITNIMCKCPHLYTLTYDVYNLFWHCEIW